MHDLNTIITRNDARAAADMALASRKLRPRRRKAKVKAKPSAIGELLGMGKGA